MDQAASWNVLARRQAKALDSAKVRKVGHVLLKMLARSTDEQTARGYAAMGNVWNSGAIEAYVYTVLPEQEIQAKLAEWRQQVEAAGLSLVRASVEA